MSNAKKSKEKASRNAEIKGFADIVDQETWNVVNICFK